MTEKIWDWLARACIVLAVCLLLILLVCVIGAAGGWLCSARGGAGDDFQPQNVVKAEHVAPGVAARLVGQDFTTLELKIKVKNLDDARHLVTALSREYQKISGQAGD